MQTLGRQMDGKKEHLMEMNSREQWNFSPRLMGQAVNGFRRILRSSRVTRARFCRRADFRLVRLFFDRDSRRVFFDGAFFIAELEFFLFFFFFEENIMKEIFQLMGFLFIFSSLFNLSMFRVKIIRIFVVWL